MQELYFDDFETGQQFHSKGATLSETQILDFALLYDPQPFHLDKEAAAEGPFNGLIASGFQTLSLAFRLFYQANVINACSMGSPGFDELRWLRPVRPGDTLRVAGKVKEMRPSRSKPDRGTLLMDYTVTNQDGQPVMTFTAIHILARKAS
ncbi:MaoC family dehydratase [Pelagibius litoralis]|uniref:MaoC family dehydratase n=1 Tax=Pelagibius litoralis TaxID=374515 RepID=A0A967EZV5_9PROT|nr:MaoC family dehydratase [Pelagibius litoralis]NIA70477.1 MaoC family dehydratase [Pelagibius litoralis]